jgi:hypothetical protein
VYSSTYVQYSATTCIGIRERACGTRTNRRSSASHNARQASRQQYRTHDVLLLKHITAAPSLLADRNDRTGRHSKVRTQRYGLGPRYSLLALDKSQSLSHSCVRVIFETRKHGLTLWTAQPPLESSSCSFLDQSEISIPSLSEIQVPSAILVELVPYQRRRSSRTAHLSR